MRILVVNAGSSSLKLSLLDDADRTLADVSLAIAGGEIDLDGVLSALSGPLGEADAVGHRIVHGGERFHSAVRIDDDVERALRDLAELAPLHQRRSLAAFDAVNAAIGGVPAYACFDTAFHATLPRSAATYALPTRWRERWGLRRYGFHGLSHAWVARRAPQVLDADPRDLRIVSCHLGAGASLCAITGGCSIDTTMGFTPLEGLVMATRSGSVDPGMLLWLLQHKNIAVGELADALEHRSGLLGLAGSADMREVLNRAERGEDAARLALDVYLHRLRAGIAAMTAALGGLDVLAFTGGIGERSSEVRARTAADLGFLGIALDEAHNYDAGADVDVATVGAPVRTLVIAAREDLEIARQVRALDGA